MSDSLNRNISILTLQMLIDQITFEIDSQALRFILGDTWDTYVEALKKQRAVYRVRLLDFELGEDGV